MRLNEQGALELAWQPELGRSPRLCGATDWPTILADEHRESDVVRFIPMSVQGTERGHGDQQIKVLYFASIREASGTGAESLQNSAATVGALREELICTKGEAAAAALAPNKAVRMALNQLMVGSTPIKDGDEVAFSSARDRRLR